MNEVCVDANLIVKLVLKGELYRANACKFVKDCGTANITMIAPPVFESELDSIIRKRVFDGRLKQIEAQLAYNVLDKIPVLIINHTDLRTIARKIAEQFNQRHVYDSTYAALAEIRVCEMWTADKAFYNAVKAELTFVKYLPDYS